MNTNLKPLSFFTHGEGKTPMDDEMIKKALNGFNERRDKIAEAYKEECEQRRLEEINFRD